MKKSLMTTVAVCCLFLAGMRGTIAASVETIGPENRFPLQGKEADWIDGDFVLRSDTLVAVIARPGKTRDANMTTRGAGGGLIDLTRVDMPSDQLSCFYPAAGRYQFFDDALVETGDLGDGGVFVRCRASKALAENGTTATVEYQVRDGQAFVTVITVISASDGKAFRAADIAAVDGVRADRTFDFDSIPATNIAYCTDIPFRQTYGFESVGARSAATWSKDRMRQLRHGAGALQVAADNQSVSWTTRIYPAASAVDLWGLSQNAKPQTIKVTRAVGDQPRMMLSIVDGSAPLIGPLASWRVDPSGKSIVHLPAGKYRMVAQAIGHQSAEVDVVVSDQPAEHSIELGRATSYAVKVVDQDGNRIPCKATFYGIDPTADPVFGVDSQSGSVGNCVYSADGEFVRSIDPGTYQVFISYGPEYDCFNETVTIEENVPTVRQVTLNHSVDTSGWISAELHSHSSPSGDNTSDQLGRVENLLCEQIDFAPCTEHQRIESYDDQLAILNATDRMATCNGMELTGQPLPINHQNAFPLKISPFAQDGGGPRTDTDPVAQIARLAMWDDNADKVVQTNHPRMKQMLSDRDMDGTEDGGFSKMLDYMDIMEVHPPEDLFYTDETISKLRRPEGSRMKPWVDLIASGRRIPGVVNTDAHYNWHGSGWLRNWVRCTTDVPAEIQVDEMIDRLERGQIVMSTGPFLSVVMSHPSLDEPAHVGDEVTVDGDEVELAVRVQCPNWLDINRVEVWVDGKMQKDLTRTRGANPDAFGDGVVKFDQTMRVQLASPNSFIIVGAIGEGLELGPVFGKEFGERPPVAVTNPIYVKRAATAR